MRLYLVHTGRPSWHQRRAGHRSQGVTILGDKAAAAAYLATYKSKHPDDPAWIEEDEQ